MSNNLESLVKIIRSRRNKDKTSSYTAFLLSKGPEKCIDKLQEEFDELKEALNSLAAATKQSVVEDTKKKALRETADLIYHLLVALEGEYIKFEDVIDELKKREDESGLDEKKNRK
jgi:phosphoribosyl-ATP pyrophosphohydrolase